MSLGFGDVLRLSKPRSTTYQHFPVRAHLDCSKYSFWHDEQTKIPHHAGWDHLEVMSHVET